MSRSNLAVHFDENTGSTYSSRKPGLETISRSAFKDRAVNEDVKTLTLPPQCTPKKEKQEKDSLFCDTFSYKDFKDDYEDIRPKSERLTLEKIRNIVYSYSNNYEATTPPPKFDDQDDSGLEMLTELDELSAFSDDEVSLQSVDDIPLPNFDDLSFSAEEMSFDNNHEDV